MKYYLNIKNGRISQLPYPHKLEKFKNYIEITKAQFDFKNSNKRAVWQNNDFALLPFNLVELKALKLDELENWQASQFANGFVFSGNTFKFSEKKKTRVADQWITMQMNITAGESTALQFAFLTNTNRTQIKMDYPTYIQFASQYAKAYKSVIVAFSKKRNMIKKATTKTALNNITI